MAPVFSLLTAAIFASAALANPVVTVRDSAISVPFVKRITKENLKGLVGRDQARAAAFKSRGNKNAKRQASVPVTNEVVSYIAAVQVGSPPTTFDLIVDTGSSNTWVGAGTKFKKTSTSVDTGSKVSVTYGSGSFSGEEFTDTVALSSALTITKQSIGVASKSTGFQGVDGIIGIGPLDLTEDTLNTGGTIPTVTQNLASQGKIPTTLVAVSFEPTTSEEVTNGELTFGGTDSSKFTGSISFTPITKTSPANEFWGIDQSITLGSTTILAKTAGIVDTGTTLILLASNAFSKYQSATGGVLDNNTGLLRLTSAQFNKLGSLNFVVNGVTFALTANAQLWPRALNTDIGGVANDFYLVVNNLGSPSGEGLDFINGQTFLERFYSVFDTTNNRVGFATTPFTTATTN